ncbi:hypothetical protein AAFC00_004168 [Neodothiora populina]|uniref:Uncharacterized protein n=1 Tax=Neodothiora populina TaxID=2781224 RepID=A0ABR3PIT4_9PEZI
MSTHCLASPNATPFIITVQDAILLDSSEGFSILRQYLADNSCNTFCEEHNSEDEDDLQAWTVMRDILHALLAPIVALTSHATHTAQKWTKSERPSDVEFAFRSRGRNAFVWLQSFLADDEDWCLSKACPGCVVQHSIDGECQIRVLLAACMLSDAHGPGPQSGPTLPSFDFFVNVLRQALAEDELWGPDYYEHAETRAQDLNFGMQDLIKQCEKLEKVMTPPQTPEETPLPSFSYFSNRRRTIGTSSKTMYPKLPEQPGMRVKRTKIAKVQAKMAQEEEAWLLTIIERAWLSLNPNRTELPTLDLINKPFNVGGP